MFGAAYVELGDGVIRSSCSPRSWPCPVDQAGFGRNLSEHNGCLCWTVAGSVGLRHALGTRGCGSHRWLRLPWCCLGPHPVDTPCGHNLWTHPTLWRSSCAHDQLPWPGVLTIPGSSTNRQTAAKQSGQVPGCLASRTLATTTHRAQQEAGYRSTGATEGWRSATSKQCTRQRAIARPLGLHAGVTVAAGEPRSTPPQVRRPFAHVASGAASVAPRHCCGAARRRTSGTPTPPQSFADQCAPLGHSEGSSAGSCVATEQCARAVPRGCTRDGGMGVGGDHEQSGLVITELCTLLTAPALQWLCDSAGTRCSGRTDSVSTALSPSAEVSRLPPARQP